MCEYYVSASETGLDEIKILSTSNYEKALDAYSMAKKEKYLYISLCIKMDDKWVALKQKWNKRKLRK